ncbi:44285_t:CDS:2, partial [Gigaspora margarita]
SWIFYNSSTIYLLQTNISNISLSFNPNVNHIPELKVSTCISCKNPSSRFLFLYLLPMSKEITSVPLYKRKYPSPIYLYCSLEKTPNSNPYLEYRSLIGTNDNNSNNLANNSIYNDKTLYCATNWLAQNNLYLLLPVFIIEEDDKNLYYDDIVIKYMSHPYGLDFENLTYSQYFKKYLIIPSPLALTQYREPYFYQQLLLKVLSKNKSDYKITPNGTY